MLWAPKGAVGSKPLGPKGPNCPSERTEGPKSTLTALPPPVHSPGIGAITPALASTHTHTLTYAHCPRSGRHLHAHTPCLHAQSHRPTPALAHTHIHSAALHQHSHTRPCTHASPMYTLTHTHAHRLAGRQTCLRAHTCGHAHSTHWQVLWIHRNHDQCLAPAHPHLPPHRESVYTVLLTGTHLPLPPPLQPLVRTLPEMAAGGTDSCPCAPPEMGG